MLESPVFGLFDTFFELEQYRKNWPMKLRHGNNFFWGRSGLFPVHGLEIFVVQKGQFYGPKFFTNFEIKKKSKRLDFQTLHGPLPSTWQEVNVISNMEHTSALDSAHSPDDK